MFLVCDFAYSQSVSDNYSVEESQGTYKPPPQPLQPLQTPSKEERKDNDCTKLTCYWRAQCYSSNGGFAINDGTFWGCYKSSSEVYSECEKEAKRNTQGWNCSVVGCDCW
jgi:hypothetical protein